MKDLAVSADGLTVAKGKTLILDNLTLKITSGTIAGLIGPSGSGKTTLMRAIVGVQRYRGNLTVLGQVAGDVRLRSRIGYVTQSPAIYLDLTVLQNLYYFGALVGADRSKIKAVIDQVRLQKQGSQLVENLSGGQKARVSLAIALLSDPDLYVLDEPTVGLDPVLRNELWDTFRALSESGKTLLVSSHVMEEAERCDELLLMRDGMLLWNDTREALLKKTQENNVNDAFVKMVQSSEGA